MTDKWRPGYPACAATPEDDGPNFDSPVMANTVLPGMRRLREAEAFNKVAKETALFHERQAYKYGVDNPRGQAHFKAARTYRESAGRLQEMFNQGGDPAGQLPPKAVMKANKAAIGFHKKQAEKAGLDSDIGQAHVAALNHHLDIHKKAKAQHMEQKQQQQSAGGHGSKQSPVPVPKKSEQPSEDIRQQKPAVPLAQLRGKQMAAARKKEAGGRGPFDKQDCTEPSKVSKQIKKSGTFAWREPRGTKLRDDKFPKAASPRVHGGHDTKGGTLKREADGMVAQRYDKSHPEGFVSDEYKDMKKPVQASGRPGSSWSDRQRKKQKKMSRESLGARLSRESRHGGGTQVVDSDAGHPATLSYERPSRIDGWNGGVSYSPPIKKQTEATSGVVIKEF